MEKAHKSPYFLETTDKSLVCCHRSYGENPSGIEIIEDMELLEAEEIFPCNVVTGCNNSEDFKNVIKIEPGSEKGVLLSNAVIVLDSEEEEYVGDKIKIEPSKIKLEPVPFVEPKAIEIKQEIMHIDDERPSMIVEDDSQVYKDFGSVGNLNEHIDLENMDTRKGPSDIQNSVALTNTPYQAKDDDEDDPLYGWSVEDIVSSSNWMDEEHEEGTFSSTDISSSSDSSDEEQLTHCPKIGLGEILKCIKELQLSNFHTEDIADYYESRCEVGSKRKLYFKVYGSLKHYEGTHFRRRLDGKWAYMNSVLATSSKVDSGPPRRK